MKSEILIWVVPVSFFAIWFIAAPHSAARFYSWMNPHRLHSNVYAQTLRVGGVLILVYMILLLTGVLK